MRVISAVTSVIAEVEPVRQRMLKKPAFWKFAAIAQAGVLVVLVSASLWLYPRFRAARHHFLDRACAFGDVTGVALLLRLGADPNGWRDYPYFERYIAQWEPEYPLFQALHYGDPKIVQMLLEAGADPNPPLPDPARHGTLLGWAALNGYADAARMLHEAGAPLALPHGLTAIDLARKYGHSDVVRVLQNPIGSEPIPR